MSMEANISVSSHAVMQVHECGQVSLSMNMHTHVHLIRILPAGTVSHAASFSLQALRRCVHVTCSIVKNVTPPWLHRR